MIGFERKRGDDDFFNTSLIGMKESLDNKQMERLKRIRQYWNFYEGYHWEDLTAQDTPELTINYCRAFVDKFVAFELGKAFAIVTSPKMEGISITKDGRTIFEYLEDIWEDNDMYQFIAEIGQTKSVTGEAWVQVRYYEPTELDDPFNEYPEGRIKLTVLPNNVVFPEFDPHELGVLRKLTIMYSYEKFTKTPILGIEKKERVVYKQVWTREEIAIIDGREEPVVVPNRYKAFPFVQIKNLTISNRNEGRSDLEDIIPLNTEYNMKESNVSEIIDYHSAPVTIVYGAKIGNLEKGANKMWGGLAKDARVENLELKSDLTASSSYIQSLKIAMCEIAGIPETILGGSQAISNTSGVALQYMSLPLIEKTRLKRLTTETGIETLNKLILLISLFEGLITKPDNIDARDFFWNEVKVPDTLPKDMLIELQQINQEMSLKLESRRNAMKRLGKEDIEELIKEIDEEAEQNPEIFGMKPEMNSGMMNGETPVEMVRKEMTGKNG